jgi:thiamine-phosphate pyrophosphorylase
MTDADRLPDPAAAVARLPRGSAVILRHYGVPGRDALARDLVALCRGRHIRVLIAADARLARAVGADGLHLPEAMARRGPGIWQPWRRPDWIVTAAAHSRAALFRAARAGADAALLSPVFWTASHPLAPALGPLRFAAWCRSSPLPVYALGGISARTARRLRAGGGAGFAGISGFTAES